MQYGIIANVKNRDRCLRLGSKAWLIGGTGGMGWYKFVWVGRTSRGRLVKKWVTTKRFTNFRCAWIPNHIRDRAGGHLYMEGTRPEMEERAIALNEFRYRIGEKLNE